MAYEVNPLKLSLESNGDLSAEANQFKAVKANAAGKAVLADTAGEAVLGILQNRPGAGAPAEVAWLGPTKALAGAVIANAMTPLKVDATGRLVAAQTAYTKTDDAGIAQDPLVGSNVVGHNLTAASAAGDVITVLLLPRGAVPATAA